MARRISLPEIGGCPEVAGAPAHPSPGYPIQAQPRASRHRARGSPERPPRFSRSGPATLNDSRCPTTPGAPADHECPPARFDCLEQGQSRQTVVDEHPAAAAMDISRR